MTTGTTTSDARVTRTLAAPEGGPASMKVGPYRYKTWSGADRAAKLRSERPVYQGFPRRPDLENRLPNEDTRSFKRRRRKLLNEWLAQVRQWQQNRPKRRVKPKVSYQVVMPPNPYTMSLTRKCDTVYAVRNPVSGSWGLSFMQPLNPTGRVHEPLDPQDHYAVIEKLRRKAYGSGFHPGIFSAEAPKALKMIATSATQIRNGLASLVKGNWRGIVRNLGTPTGRLYGKARYSYLSFHEGRMSLSEAWLAFQYGWRPLYKDLHDGAAAIAEINYGANKSLVRSLSARKSFATVQWNDFGSQALGFRQKVTVHHVRYVITDLSVSSPYVYQSMTSFAAVAWEIVPYSFVFDWVAPISGYLQAMRTAADLKGTVVCTVFSQTSYSFPEVKPGWQYIPMCPDLTPQYEDVSVTRTVSRELIPPIPMGDLSPGSVFSDWRRAANAVALLKGLRFPELDKLGFKKLILNRGPFKH